MELLEFIKKWCIVSIIMFIGVTAAVYLSKRFSRYISKFPFLLYGLHPVSAHVILSELYKQRRITLLNIVSVVLVGNIILKIKEFLMYSVPIGIYVLQELWKYLLLVAIIYLIYLSLFATIFLLKFRIQNISIHEEFKHGLSWKRIIKLFLRVWTIYTIVYYVLTFLLISNYMKYIIEFLKLLSFNPITSMLLTTYMFSPVATWHFIKYFHDTNSITIPNIITIFVIGRYLHFILHVLRDGIPILTSLYGLRSGLKIVCINVLILSVVYMLTYLTLI